MPVDPVGATLGSIAIIFPLYDACNRMYMGWRVMEAVGTDWDLALVQLESLWNRLYLIMRRRQADLVDPIDADDRDHRVTRNVHQQLSVIKLYFERCDETMKEYLFKVPKVGVSGSSTAAEPSTSGVTSPDGTLTPSSSNAVISASSSRTSDPSTAPTTAKHRSGLKKVFYPKSWKKQKAKIDMEPIPNVAIIQEQTERLSIAVLETPEADQARSERDEDALQIRAGVGFIRRFKWAHHGKDRFTVAIRTLRTAIGDLHNILQCRQPVAQTQLIPLPANWKTKPYANLEIQRSLERLEALIKAKNTTSKGKPTFRFDVYIASTAEENWRSMKEQDSYLPLRDGSLAFYMQMYTNDGVQKGSVFLVVDTQRSPPEQLPTSTIAEITDLASVTTVPPTAHELFEVWGRIGSPGKPEDQHYLFRKTGVWKSRTTLAALFDQDGFRQQLGILSQLKLASLVVQARLDFAKTNTARFNSRLENIVYYEADQQADEEADQDPYYFHPYLSIGFGQPPLRRRAGASTQTRPENNAMIELGLILYQLGSKKKIESVATMAGIDALSVARNKAIADLDSVGALCGTQYQSAVEICLTFRNVETNRLEAETLMLERVLSAIDHSMHVLKAVIQ